LWFSLEYIIIPFGPTNIFALFLQHMSPSSWSIEMSLLLSPSMTSLFSPCLKRFIWTFGNSVGNLLEPSLCHHEVCVLDVESEFLSLAHVQLLKDVTVKIKKKFICFLGNQLELVMHVRSILEMVDCYLHLNEKFLYAHQATD
jgi:hypothetical protein